MRICQLPLLLYARFAIRASCQDSLPAGIHECHAGATHWLKASWEDLPSQPAKLAVQGRKTHRITAWNGPDCTAKRAAALPEKCVCKHKSRHWEGVITPPCVHSHGYCSPCSFCFATIKRVLPMALYDYWFIRPQKKAHPDGCALMSSLLKSIFHNVTF